MIQTCIKSGEASCPVHGLEQKVKDEMESKHRALWFLATALTLGLVTSTLSVTRAEAGEHICSTLNCSSASDCGTKCFCNTPSGMCFEN
jgi:hypothetical protein